MTQRFLLIATLVLSSASALDCGSLNQLGKGELGKTPNWLIPYCTGTAEKLESKMRAAYPDAKLIQVYEVMLNDGNVGSVASKLNATMAAAGYKFVGQKSASGVTNINYYNPKNKHGYTVFVGPKQIDYFFALVKYKP